MDEIVVKTCASWITEKRIKNFLESIRNLERVIL